jgi:hypothetical protein
MSMMIRPDSGTKSRQANNQDVNKYINELEQQLTRSRAETQKAKDKLNCLISLVRRYACSLLFCINVKRFTFLLHHDIKTKQKTVV